MLDINLLRENSKIVKDSEKKRHRDPKIVDEVLALDQHWKKVEQRVEVLKHQRNVVSQEINTLKKEGESVDPKIKEMKSVNIHIFFNSLEFLDTIKPCCS